MIFVFTEYFTPAIKAGGPITSITNLLLMVNGDFRVFARGQDVNETRSFAIKVNQWTNNSKNWYVGLGFCSLYWFWRELLKYNQHIFYVNGVFDIKMNFLPILFSKRLIIAPRGMLQNGALVKGWVKKICYLMVLRIFLRNKKVIWHATDEVEANDIATIFGRQKEITAIPNLVKEIEGLSRQSNKKSGHLNLVYYSLISEKKNLKFMLDILNNISISFELHIYGPVKDLDYANSCKQYVLESSNLVGKVKFHGTINSKIFGHVADQYDYFILPTLGENFGHAIVESLSCGLPVIISDQTPWVFNTSTYNFSIPLNDTLKWKETLVSLAALDVLEHQQAKENAFMFYKDQVLINQLSAIQAYQTLFQE